jgi:hypothetical protein
MITTTKPVEMPTDELMQAAAKVLPQTLVTTGTSSVGDELSIRAARLGQLLYEAKEQGSQPMRSIQGVTGDQAMAVLTVINAPSPAGSV